MRREGVQPSWMVFIPFLGAAVGARSLGGSALAEARVGLAGPVLGTLGTLVVAGIYLATGNDFWRALAFVGFFLNLFNLLPVLPLDGGRAMAAMAPWMWFVGFAALLIAADRRPQPDPDPHPADRRDGDVAPLEAAQVGRSRATPPTTRSSRSTASLVGAVYVGLLVLLGVGMDLTHLARTFSDV